MAVPALVRLPSGIAGLDRILGGGLMKGSIYILQGAPGTGKTIFSNQMCFHHVANGGRAVFVTLLAENHARMIANIQNLSFYDERCFPDSIRYLSAFAEIHSGGLGALLKLLRTEIQRRRVSMLVIDGLVSARESAATPEDFRIFIHGLQEIALATDCTMLLTTNAGDTISPEQTMVDGLIKLTDNVYGWRAESDLQVTKFRGSAYLRGRHAYRITDDGIMVYPRLETLPIAINQNGESRRRVLIGVNSLDQLLGGGLPHGSSTVLAGASGVGKTTLGLQYLAAASAAEPGLMFSFYEQPGALLVKADSLGIPLRAHVGNGAVALEWQPQTADPLDALGHRLLDHVRQRGVRRLVIDGLSAFRAAAVDKSRTGVFLAVLTGHLRQAGVTTIVTMELPALIGPISQLPADDLSSLSDNLVLMRHVEERGRLTRLISILKVRNGMFDDLVTPFAIGAGGVLVGGVTGGDERDSHAAPAGGGTMGTGTAAAETPAQQSRIGPVNPAADLPVSGNEKD